MSLVLKAPKHSSSSSSSSHSMSSSSSPDPAIKTKLGEISWREDYAASKIHRWTQKSIVKREKCAAGLWEKFFHYDNKYYSGRRWGKRATIKLISQATIDKLRENLFQTAKNHFRTPTEDSFTVNAHLANGSHLVTPIHDPNDVAVYTEVETRPCERKVEKCRACRVRFRCITQRND